MFSKILDKIKGKNGDRPIYLGDIFVNPRSDLKAAVEIGSDYKNTPEELRDWVSDLLEMPFIEDASDVPYNALILDVAITKYQAGTDVILYSNDFILPFFWRPSVSLKVRLRKYHTNIVLGEHSTKKIVPWIQYLNRVFSVKGFFSFKNSYTSEDLRHLLGTALLESLVWANELR